MIKPRDVPALLFAAVSLLPLSVAAGATDVYQTEGVKNGLPVFTPQVVSRLTFPLSWSSGNFSDFSAWRETARSRVLTCLLAPPPPAAWDAHVIAEEDRGNYIARKVVFNLTGDSRILALMTVPKGRGPFPAVLLLHDHGAQFDIGKEKLIRPWGAPESRIKIADAWVAKYYGGKYIGDELAQRGYVCLAIDALNWSDRGGGGYDGKQALASNLLHLGMSFAGVIAWEDLRSAEFLAAQPEVKKNLVSAVGFSMGAQRAWQVAALSDHITAGVAICWMNTVAGLMVPGNNETRGSSSFAMTHPGLANYLDYPDVASIACPKPMLFYNGSQDKLFPVAGVRVAYDKLHSIWKSQRAESALETRVWDTPHIFNLEMQEAAFAWLAQQNARLASIPSKP